MGPAFHRRHLLLGLGAVAGFPAHSVGASLQRSDFRLPARDTRGVARGPVIWEGRPARISGGATHFRGLDHAIGVSAGDAIVRLEVRNTPSDRREQDRAVARRSEIAFPEARFPNGGDYWAAVSVRPERYSRPDSLGSTPEPGGPFFQIHADDAGSPSVALRRTPDDRLCVTAAGAGSGVGIVYRTLDWRLDAPHHFVLRFRLDPRHGALSVWMDGARIVDARDIPLGLGKPGRGSFIKMGCYYPRGLGPDREASVANAFASFIPPGATSLLGLVQSPPAWPDVCCE